MAMSLLMTFSFQGVSQPKLTQVTALLDGRDFLANNEPSAISVMSSGRLCNAVDAYSVYPQDSLVGHVGGDSW